jgi:hypothetical protein
MRPATNPMKPRSAVVPYSVAIVVGMALWFAAAALGGKREAWDGPAYWAGAWPMAILVSGWLGYSFPDRPWRWALALFEAQFVAMAIRNGELGNLWPMGIVIFAVVALPAMGAAWGGARLARAGGGQR